MRRGNYRKYNNSKNTPQRNFSNAAKINTTEKYGYFGFTLYFPDEECDRETISETTVAFTDFFKQNQSAFEFDLIIKKKSFYLDYSLLLKEDEINDNLNNFNSEIVDNTEFYLKCAGLAMHQYIIETKYQNDKENTPNLPKINARIHNYDSILQLKDLRVNYYGKLVAVRGTVIKAGNVKIISEYLPFSCSLCNGMQLVKQIDGTYCIPKKCGTEGCRKQSNFIPLPSSEHSRTLSKQSITIQELIGSNDYGNGRVPRTLDCEFLEDLVNTCIPGDDVTITGILFSKKKQTVFELNLRAVSVFNSKNNTQGSYGASARITFNQDDYYAIQEIHSTPHLFKYLVQSFCPNIYGHEIVKAGLLLALFGGTKSANVRAESHVLMVGDPGLGKSQMLQACTNVAPRGVYVCGNTSTSSGLTITMGREPGGQYCLEAGALMLADQGCCCIDEFDKMPAQHACLLEAMEQQSISIAKAGIVCTLPTRTTILAAANPAGGHYNKSKTIAENLKISSPMLSRFDLIFILLDQPNEEWDNLLSKHVLAQHTGVKSELNNGSILDTSITSDKNSLRNKLKLSQGEQMNFLPHKLFRKYIAYAQNYVNPQISYEAKTVIREFYMSLRKQFQTGESTPVTTRQLNSLIRLTQARAKTELREEATEQDALEVIEIMRHTLLDIFTDEFGKMDTTRSQNGTGMSIKKLALKLLQLLQRHAETETRSIFPVKDMKIYAEQAGIPFDKFQRILQSLNIQGYLLYKGQNNYQLVSGDV